MACPGNAHTHNNETEILTFQKKPDMAHDALELTVRISWRTTYWCWVAHSPSTMFCELPHIDAAQHTTQTEM